MSETECAKCKGLGYIPDTKLERLVKILTFNSDLKRCPKCGGTGKGES